MQFCKKCGVSVNGDKKCCPLCQGRLSGEAEPEKERYPQIPMPKYSRNFIMKFVTFAAIFISVVSYAVNLVVTPDFKWSVIAALAALCAWAATVVGIAYHRRIIKSIMWELLLITPITVLWDINTGWHKWSVDFVLPCLCGAAIIATAVITAVMKYPPREYMLYLCAEAVYGIVPFVLYMLGVTTVALPSVICSALSVLSISAVILFMGKNAGSEVKRKFHL